MSDLLDRYITKIREHDVKVDSVFVEEGGALSEAYINQPVLHELRSCSKVLIAFAYGIAIEEKFRCKYTNETLSLDTEVYSTFSAIYDGVVDNRVKLWTIKTLLTHSTGYEKMMFNERHLETIDKDNLFKVLFETEIKYQPNEHFTYSNVEPYLLSIFFQENFGVNISDFIRDRIFKPLSIDEYVWNNLGKYCAGATGLYLSHKDFHKLGKLLMDNGKYEGRQIIPSEWISEILKPQMPCPNYYKKERLLPKCNAGYFVWISRDDIIFRDGSGGQYIICDFNKNILITIMSTEKDMSKVTECLRGLL